MYAMTHERLYRYDTLEVQAPMIMRSGAWQGIVLVFLIASAIMAFVWLRSNTERLQRELVQTRKAHEIQGKTMENLGIELETYKSGRYVLAAVQRFELGLRPPTHGQVRRVTLPVMQKPDAGPPANASNTRVLARK